MAISRISSGAIDVNAIVAQLMKIEQRPLTALAVKEAGIQAKVSAIGSLKSALASLQTAVEALTKAATFNARSATVSGDQVSASATSAAAEGTYAVEVTALARAQSLASAPLAAPTTVVGGGTLTLQRGTYDSGANTFTPATDAAPVTITIDPGSTVEQVRDAINAAGAGITATLVTDASGTRLTLRANASGAANSFRITVDDGDGVDTDTAGLSQLAFDPTAAAGSGKNLTETQAASDATVRINGLTVTSASNTVTGAIEGVTLTLKKAAPGSTSEVSVARDKNAVNAAVNAFVKAYNDLAKSLASAMSYDPASKRAGPLNGDAAARAVQAQLRSALGASQSGAATFSTLSSVGIGFERDGTLKFDSAKLEAALASDAQSVVDLFTKDTGETTTAGLALRINELVKSLLGEQGPIKARSDGLQASLDLIADKREDLNRRLVTTEKRLRDQFTALDAMLAKLQARGDSLVNALAQLPGARKSA